MGDVRSIGPEPRTPLRADAVDAPALHRLIDAVAPGSWTLDRLGAELARPDSLCVWLQRDGRARSLALGRVVLDELHVLDVAVDAASRRRGVGRLTLGALLREGESRGCRLALLEVRESNRAACALYRSAGFMVVGRRPRYYPGGEAATLMNRSLAEPPPPPQRAPTTGDPAR